ncbi:hypothetical protein F5Y15DRAFT_265825 [Xylariaceae sp. FL0016]|nr:hypothetical protein F5Y15DRAFT_265825 [Xylariaceae sp. FL0016]
MLFRAVSTVAVMALAVAAEPTRQPYQPKLFKMSTRQLFGLERRDGEGYSPSQELCGSGATCAEACGTGFKQCASDDSVTHCYNAGNDQTCCPAGTGESCDDGYFCSADDQGETWCCPDSMTLAQCAKKYGLPGPLTSDTATPTATSSAKATAANAQNVATAVTTTTGISSIIVSAQSESASQSQSIIVLSDYSYGRVSQTPGCTADVTPNITTAPGPQASATDATIISISTSLSVDNCNTSSISTTNTATKTSSEPTSTTSTESQSQGLSTSGSGTHNPSSRLVFLFIGALAAFL